MLSDDSKDLTDFVQHIDPYSKHEYGSICCTNMDQYAVQNQLDPLNHQVTL
jgi:hypothetical protein